ncbi:MAG: PHP domain-containing protein [Eubacteriales bacterium]|nr:PHP domain-containing protein [Eubacteriales bacterium]MDD3882249.1 PHP domain-containing protein [Eubacteriales bacterium]MDD4512598.1 PHP domain-containing protein [Eubacteriales bacterium]
MSLTRINKELAADLHTHTTVSDGDASPKELVSLALGAGLNLLAVTDHDAVGGIAMAQQAAEGTSLSVLPGVEISTGGVNEYHILAYGDVTASEELMGFLSVMRKERDDRMLEIYARLEAIGISLTPLARADGKSIGRMHVGHQLVAAGYAKDVDEACERYLAVGKAGYVPRAHRDAGEIISKIAECGLVPVLAHPYLYKLPLPSLSQLIDEWTSLGLKGIEVYHPTSVGRDIGALMAIAKRCGLIVTGGSDYHGHGSMHAPLGGMCKYWQDMSSCCENLLTAISKPQNS